MRRHGSRGSSDSSQARRRGSMRARYCRGDDDDGGLFTCGMHQFDLPDAEIAMSDAREVIAWLDAFCTYQLAEQPALVSGHTFRPDANATRRTIERWPDHRHPPNDGRHNPFGLWRFKEPGTSALKPRALVSTIMPPLVADSGLRRKFSSQEACHPPTQLPHPQRGSMNRRCHPCLSG
jgi:hypothetical protein